MFFNSNYKAETLQHVLLRDPDLTYVHDDIELDGAERRLDHPKYDDSSSSFYFDWLDDRDTSTDDSSFNKLSQNCLMIPDDILPKCA